MACHGLFISNTPFNKDLTYFEMQVTDSAAVIGFADFDYPVDNTLGNNPNSVGYFYNGRISKDLSSVNFDEDTTLTAFKAGDTVGCGLNVERAKFRENGLLENEQTLQFYFTKNNIKVQEVDFEYKSNGIYPAVNVYPGGNGVILHNYFQDSENKATKKVASIPPKDVANFIEGCRFTLVGLEENDGNLNEKLHLIEKTLSEGIQFSIIELITQYIHQYESELKSMDFQKQELYSNLCWQKECLERFLKNLRVTLKTVNLSSGKGHEELCKHIIDVCEADLTYHRQFYSLSEKVAEGLHKIREVLKKENIMFIDHLLKAEPNAFGTNTHICEAAVSYLKNKGQILCFTMNEAKVAVDREFLLQLEGKFKNLPSALSGKQAQCIGEKTNILNNLTDIIPNTKNLSFSQMETIIKVLSIIGIKRIPCLRSSRDDPVFCYCMQIDQQALQLSDFIQSANTNATELERKYHLLHTSAKHMFSICVSRFLTFSKAIVIGQEWCVFQNGDIQTIFYTKGDHVLKVKSHCFQPQNTDKLSQESMLEIQENTFTLFSIFVDVIDEIIKRMGISFVYKELIPSKLVNGSIGCIHQWELSEEHSRKTICTLCGNCCEKGLYCEFNGVKGDNLHKCCCETHVTGCKHCGVCKNCAEMTWAVESYLRPNLEVTSYEQMKAMPTTPLLLSAYDEVEFTNLGRSKAPLCLKMDIDINKQRQQKRRLIKIFPFKAFEYTYKNQLQNDVSYWHQSNQIDKTLGFNRGDTVVFKFEKILKFRKSTSEMENPITPAYFSCKNQFVAVCHEFGLLLHTAYPANSIYGRNTFGQFLSARPLTPKCPSFSIRIINLGSKSVIAIGLCNQNFSKIDLPGHTQDSFGFHADDGCIYLKEKQFSTRHVCKTGDTMKCELDFKKKCIQFYHNGAMIYRTEELKDINNLHAIIAFGSYFEAVHLLEKEPWQIDGTEEQLDFPQAYDVKKYENMWFSPATTVGLSNRFDHYWLLIYNPTMKSIGFRMTPQLESSTVISCLGSLKHCAICVPVDKYLSMYTH
ncbi:uncharacterized protein LOC131939043 isoform X2 [Physella acuta]|nr:uncharacterized protein LOC131939043 isoform X2 [Physella acuta]